MTVVPSRPLPPGIPPDWAGARRVFEAATKGLQCRDLLHVNSRTCSDAWIDMYTGCFLGSVQYFFPFYAVQVIWNGKRALSGDRDFFKQLAYMFARSILFGATMGTTFSISSCSMVRLCGYSFWSCILVPGVCSGLSIFIDHISRRRIVMNTWYNLALQYLYVRAQVAQVVRRTATGETAVFMVINSLLLYLLHGTKGTKKRGGAPIFWFFIPETERVEVRTNSTSCPVPHKDTCWKSLIQTTARYSALAAALQAVRVVMSKGSNIVQNPATFFREFISKKTAAGITSVGGYVLIYKAVRCALARQYGTDKCEHSALAGMVAGTAYWLQPNTTILTSALIATIRLLHDFMPEQFKLLGQWPMPELIFALCNGILFHARCMDMAHCPRFIIHMMDTATRNRSKTIYSSYLQHVQNCQLRE